MANVMIVDDDRNVLNYLSDVIAGNSNFHVESFDNPELALEQISNGNFDVIVSDYHMGTMNGVEFLEESRRRSPDSARILLSGLADMAVLTQSINRCEIYQYIPKPWKTMELMEIITQASSACHERKEKEKAASLVGKNTRIFSLSNFVGNMPIKSCSPDGCEGTSYRERIESTLQQSFSMLGFEYFNYANYVSDSDSKSIRWEACTAHFSNYPKPLLNYYEKHNTLKLADPVNRIVSAETRLQTQNPIFGTWEDAYKQMINDPILAKKQSERSNMMSVVSDMYIMCAHHGVSSGIFMALTDMKRHTVLHLARGASEKDLVLDADLWKTICGIIQLCNLSLRHASGCPQCSRKINSNTSEKYRLTKMQKNVLKTFLDDSSASTKTAARIHNISVESVRFHLKNIRHTLNKPWTTSHALAALAQNMNLI